MTDIDVLIAGNIQAIMKEQNKKQVDLATALDTNKQTVNKMLNGSRKISAGELKQIAEFLKVKMDDLTTIPTNIEETTFAPVLMGQMDSEEAIQTLRIADEISDLVLFHKRVRENGTAMMSPWGDM